MVARHALDVVQAVALAWLAGWQMRSHRVVRRNNGILRALHYDAVNGGGSRHAKRSEPSPGSPPPSA